MSIWSTLTDAQATIIAGGMTIAAAVIGVLLGNLLFSGKVTSIQDAIDTSKDRVDGHLLKFEETLNQIREKSADLDLVLAAVSQQVGQLAETQNNGAVSEDDTAREKGDKRSEDGREANYEKSAIRDIWIDIRDHLEELASNPLIDGRTRAKYMRIDRRAYGDLIDVLEYDDVITENQAAAANGAYSKWNSFKPRRVSPTQKDIDEMQALAEKVRR